LLAAIHVPQPPERFGAAYARFGLREANAIAVAGVAAAVVLNPDRTVASARVALCAVAPMPWLAKSASAALVGHRLDEDTIDQAANAAMKEAQPITDLRGSAQYRRELVRTLTKRALATAGERTAR
jgi:carbon-monoxide dehydrogenase medium subunit